MLFLVTVGFLPFDLLGQATSVGRAPYVVSGNVRLPNGAPAPRVVVRVTSTTGSDRQTITDESGHYELRDLTRGRYVLTASNPEDPDQISDYAEVDVSRITPHNGELHAVRCEL